ncbi:MAG: sn-glycerol-1-phosphate dehydrogenase [Clostridia bacterium]|jgi:glycerol-1-phosphate dehydrogenase [NAD(P)+]|nr:sn-glycerol-1-phosphate dehydrogenase [Clostridia bacterium]
MKQFKDMEIRELLYPNEYVCDCGKTHRSTVKDIVIGKDVFSDLLKTVKGYGVKSIMVFADHNTYEAAGKELLGKLENEGFTLNTYIYPQEQVTADSFSVGQAALHFAKDSDMVLGIGTGTINDVCKIMSSISGKPYVLYATGASMDGFASDTSSMVVDGLKFSVPSKAPDAIYSDVKVLAASPKRLTRAGIGDVLAKLVSLSEWRISNIVNGEYFCRNIHDLIMKSLDACRKNAEKYVSGDEDAMKEILEALILPGVAMAYAGVTRPASGMEHYFSHLWEMRALEFGYKEYMHGEQVGVGTLLALRVYDRLKGMKAPDRESAIEKRKTFSKEDWKKEIRTFLGNSAEEVIRTEERENRYDYDTYLKRLDSIILHWDEIMEIINSMPSEREIRGIMERIGAMTEPSEMGIQKEVVKDTFRYTKDVRNKYICSSLLFDIGLLDEIADELF